MQKNKHQPTSDDLPSANAPWWFIYGFFLLHMMIFGSFGFAMSYASESDFLFNLSFSGFAILIYSFFYVLFFGIDEIRWLFINSIIGVLGIYSQLDWVLDFFNKSVEDYPIHYHLIPGIYFVLYTFLLRRALLHLLQANEGGRKAMIVNVSYVVLSILIYIGSLLIA